MPQPVTKGQSADARIVAPGQKMRTFAARQTAPASIDGLLSGLTNSEPVQATGLGLSDGR